MFKKPAKLQSLQVGDTIRFVYKDTLSPYAYKVNVIGTGMYAGYYYVSNFNSWTNCPFVIVKEFCTSNLKPNISGV